MNNSGRLCRFKDMRLSRARITQIILLTTYYLLLTTFLTGCDAFVRKFTRKPKKQDTDKVEMVLVPEEYKGPNLTKEEIYRQHLLYWRTWQDELLNSLSGNSNHKKQVDCAKEAVKNLKLVRAMLDDQMQKKFDVYLNQMEALKDAIADDLYGDNLSQSQLKAERLRRGILRDFGYAKVKGHLI